MNETPVRVSDNGLDLIKRFEGLELQAYQDIAGIWTIGYGHTGPDVHPGLRISEREAEELLRRDLASRKDAISAHVKAPLTQNKFDALVSLVYNIGASAFAGSTVLKRINAGESEAAIAEAWRWWNKATVGGVLREVLGLTKRRAAEIQLFHKPMNGGHATPIPDNGVVEEPGASAETHSITPPEQKKKGCRWW